MGIFSNTINICQFKVAGELPQDDLFQWASERLGRNGFRPIDEGAEEQSVGWVHSDDHGESSFAAPAAFLRDHYLLFSLRKDQRRIPSAVLKAHQREAEDAYLAANPGLNRVPKQKREDIRDAVRQALLGRVLPFPSTCDAVWDIRAGILTLTSLTSGTLELFETQFKKTFEGLRLVAVHPFARAEQVLTEELRPLLHKANQATSESALDLIRSNLWIGEDLLLWLLYRTQGTDSVYVVNQPGPFGKEQFVAYVNDRLILRCASENGVQKVTVAGPQDYFHEARMALRSGKRITEATLYLEKDELMWKVTLKGELFQFASFKSPAVTIEKDNTVDAASEREAVFFERMYLLEQGLQLFDSLLAAFLNVRLGGGWSGEAAAIDAWLLGNQKDA